MNKKILGTLLSLSLFATACGSQEPIAETEEKLVITTSLYPVYFFTSEIVQDKAEVFNLTPGGVEPHDYEPTPRDLQSLEASDLLVVNGSLEPWLADLKAPLEEKGVNILVLTEDMDLLEGSSEHEEEEDHDEGTKDPHVWLDPLLAYEMVEHLTRELTILDPMNAEFYEANADSLKNKLLVLNEDYTAALTSCEQSTFVTSHAAFAYLANRYGLTQLPISGLSPDIEPSMTEVAQIVDFVRENEVKVIFFESLVSPKLSETIAEEVGAETLVLNPLEGLTEADVTAGKDYFSEMEQNLTNLSVALECK
jgi:zinc transport system substrate-binding protein